MKRFFIIVLCSVLIILSEASLSMAKENIREPLQESQLLAETPLQTNVPTDDMPKDAAAKDVSQVAQVTAAIIDDQKVFASSEKLNVDPTTGTATVSIPIQVPPGRAGIQPSVSLLYNSSGSNGLAGMGWILELGNIQRSVKKGAPRYDSSDTFVLTQAGSTQELVYDSAAGFYRPQIEGAFAKIEFTSNKWIITDKKGIKYYFGEIDASRQLDPNNVSHVFKWQLDRVEDLNGNYMTVSYIKDQNQIYPDEILYTGNSQIVMPPFASVKFNYQPKTDEIVNYLPGFKTTLGLQLAFIEVKAAGSLLRRYTLNYTQDAETKRAVLSGVTQFGSDGVSSLPSTTFSYSQGSTDLSGWRGISNYPNDHIGNGLSRLIDLNGDGLPDLIRSPNGADPYQIYINNGNWDFNSVIYTTNNPPEQLNGNYEFVDLNRDGLPDILWGQALSYKVWINNGHNDFNPPFTVNVSPDIWLSNLNIRVADMNGDGFPDLLRSGYGGTNPPYSIYVNDGNGNFITQVSIVNAPPLGIDNPNVKLADFNGDGLFDLMYGDNASYRIWINNGNNGFNPPVLATYFPSGLWLSNPLVQVVDMNGDGLVDIVRSNPGNNQPYLIYLNNGNVDFDPPFQAINPPVRGTDNTNVKFIDINGDGLVDVVVGQIFAGVPYQISLNNGKNGFYPPKVISNWPNADLDDSWNMLVDFNGDGLIDFVRGTVAEPPYKVYPHPNNQPSSKPNVLVGMDNNLGAQTSIQYNNTPIKPLPGGQYKIAYSPVIFTTVKSVTTAIGSESYTTNYLLKDGLWNYPNREFRGFAYAKVIDPDGNYAETHFLQDDIYKGRPQSQEMHDSLGNLYSKTVNTWSYQSIVPGVNFIFLSKKDDFIYDGDATGRRTQEQYFYGESPQLGNLTKVVSLGEVDLATGNDIGSDTHSVETEYLNNTQNGNWLSGFPLRTSVKDNYGALVRQTSFYYDGQTVFGSLPVKGFLTKKKDWGGDAASDISPVAEYTYDNLGNLVTTKDPNNNITTVTYDSTYVMFPISTENALHHQIINEYYGIGSTPLDGGDGYRGLWGELKSTTDPNNQQGRKTYDVFGRAIATVSPLDSINYPTTTVEYALTAQGATVKTHAREKHGASGTIDSIQFYDGLGRLIQTKSESETAGKFVVSGQTQYNSRGLPEKKYLPFFSTAAMDSIDAIDTNKPRSTISYDAMGRAVRTTNPDGTYASAIYDDWSNTTIDENGHKQKSYFDAYGRLIKKEEYLGADGRSSYYTATPYTLYAATNYSYDSQGNLKQIQDNNGNITTVNYDNLGRKISMNDPDMGTWQYTYDAIGNLKTQTDAKGQGLNFNYDNLNRLVNKNSGTAFNVNYAYDDPVVNFSKGRLTSAEYALNANTEFNYDQVGNENLSVKKIDGLDYTVTRSYDAVNRLASLTFPNQGQVFYTYNAAGQIKQITSAQTGDPNTQLLLHANGPDGSTVFGDSSDFVHPVTANGNAQIDTAQYKFGGASGLFDGSGDYLSVADSDDWNFGSGDFTIDFWVRFNSVAGAMFWSQGTDVNNFHNFYLSGDGSLLAYYIQDTSSTTIEYTAPFAPSANVWYHIALVRSGNTWYMFVNGIKLTLTLVIGAPTASVPDFTGVFEIGKSTHGYGTSTMMNGWMDEFRISKGLARWTSNFTPPSAETHSDTQFFVSNVNYNSSGQITKIEFGNGDSTTYTYDSLTLRLSNMHTTNVQGTVLQDLSYAYDSSGNIRTITDTAHSASQSFAYDALNRLTQAIGSYGTKNYAYDTIGNIILKDGVSYNYGENGYGLPAGQAGAHAITSGSDGSVFRYDTNGNMISMVKGGVTYDYSYDVENRLTDVKKAAQLISKFEYDGDGGRTKKTTYTYSYPGGGGGCFLSGTPILMADGKTKSIEDIKIGDEVISYDEKTMKKVVSKVTKTFVHEAATDEYLIINDKLRVTANHQFYSKGNWLRADNLNFSAMLLDSNLNDVAISKIERIKEKEKVNVYNIEASAIGHGGGYHNYFAGGVLVHNKGPFRFPADENMPMEMMFKRNPYVNYALDAISSFIGVPEAEATTTTTTTKTTKFVGSLFEETNSSPTSHIYLGDTKIASIVNGEVLYYHGDHLGGTNVLTDASGVIKELIEYEPFGQFSRHEKYGTAEEVADFYFTGQRYDDETGLYFYNARYYNPAIGRFVTPDVFVQDSYDPQNLNRYVYVRNNPVNLTDPSGHFWFFAAAAALFKAASAYAITHPIIAGAVVGGVLGGTNSAIAGTNVGMGIGLGILGGGIGGAVGLGVGDFLNGSIGNFWAGIAGAGLGGATAGAATTGILNGDVGLGALAGFAGGVVAFGGARVWPLGADAVAGGVSSVIQGGKFGEGAKYGAIDNAITTTMDLMMPLDVVKEQSPKPGDLVFIKPGKMDFIGWGISLLEGGAFSHVGIVVDKENMVSAGPPKGVGYQNLYDYRNRQARVLRNFRGNQNVINAAIAEAKQHLPYNYVFGGRGRVCSTCVGNAISVGAGIPWTGIGPNSQFNVFKTYGE